MSYCQIITQIYDKTYKMLELAQARDWQELIHEEENRCKLLEQLRFFNPENDKTNDTEKKLKEIIEVNQLITSLSTTEKNNCLNNFKQTKVNKKAASEYSRY